VKSFDETNSRCDEMGTLLSGLSIEIPQLCESSIVDPVVWLQERRSHECSVNELERRVTFGDTRGIDNDRCIT